jgi:hypothetical protein
MLAPAGLRTSGGETHSAARYRGDCDVIVHRTGLFIGFEHRAVIGARIRRVHLRIPPPSLVAPASITTPGQNTLLGIVVTSADSPADGVYASIKGSARPVCCGLSTVRKQVAAR